MVSSPSEAGEWGEIFYTWSALKPDLKRHSNRYSINRLRRSLERDAFIRAGLLHQPVFLNQISASSSYDSVRVMNAL